MSRVGSPAAHDEAREILTDARKALYRILADDQPADDQRADDQPVDDQRADDQPVEDPTTKDPTAG